MTRLATWNVNSIRARLDHLERWLAARRPDVLALQETKVRDAEFPIEAVNRLGYRCVYAGQKSYNGVAILATTPLETVATGIPGFDDAERRVLAAQAGDLLVVNLYVPNGAAVGSDKYAYKLAWLDALADWVEVLSGECERLVLTGDFNIAPDDRDVHDPEAWRGKILCSDEERARLQRILALGMVDVFRCFEQPAGTFSWWDYRGGSFRRNHGLRIDLILTDRALARDVRACSVDAEPRRWEKPSDHAPVVAEIGAGSDP